MPSFQVQSVFYVPHRDQLVLAGKLDSGTVRGGWQIDLPREVNGPGWVPILDVQTVAFRDGRERLCVILDYETITGAPLMEFKSLEGLSLDVRPV